MALSHLGKIHCLIEMGRERYSEPLVTIIGIENIMERLDDMGGKGKVDDWDEIGS